MKNKFYKLLIHRDHLLLIDLLLNHVSYITNMELSTKLANELKEVTSQALKKAPKIYEVQIEEDD